MNWELKEPSVGDMIRVKHGSIYHHGIFVSEDEVIQFGLSPLARPGLKDSEVEVCTSDIDGFLCGGFLEVAVPDKKEKKKFRKPKKIVEEARKRIGERNYSILYNNCEHFAYECATGEHKSEQTESVRALFKSFPVVDLYAAPIPESGSLSSVYPPQRNKEIQACKHPRVRQEKYFVWKLLEYALLRSFGYRIADLTFTKEENGKWICESCEFSLSHSDGAVAVAVSRKPIGVDIQRVAPLRDVEKMAERILSDREAEEFAETAEEERNDFLLGKWTEKESIFKSMNLDSFWAADPRTLSAKTNLQRVKLGDENYLLSVASEQIDRLRFYQVDLTNL